MRITHCPHCGEALHKGKKQEYNAERNAAIYDRVNDPNRPFRLIERLRVEYNITPSRIYAICEQERKRRERETAGGTTETQDPT